MKKVILGTIYTILACATILILLPQLGVDQGVLFQRNEESLVANVNFLGNINTYVIKGEKAQGPVIEVEHKPLDKYYTELGPREQIVYDALLQRAKEIANNETTDLSVKVPLDNMGINFNFLTLESDVNAAINEIDFKKVFEILHYDYDWLFWFEFDMNWELTGAVAYAENSTLKDSYFTVKMNPMPVYENEEEFKDAQRVLNMYLQNLTFSTAEDIANFIMTNADYNDEAAEEINGGQHYSEMLYYKSAVKFLQNFEKGQTTSFVCQGYSNVFQMLCDANGLEGYSVSGTLNDTAHSWNKMVIDDEMYVIDVTNSDAETIGENGEVYFRKEAGTDFYIEIGEERMHYVEDANAGV